MVHEAPGLLRKCAANGSISPTWLSIISLTHAHYIQTALSQPTLLFKHAGMPIGWTLGELELSLTKTGCAQPLPESPIFSSGPTITRDQNSFQYGCPAQPSPTRDRRADESLRTSLECPSFGYFSGTLTPVARTAVVHPVIRDTENPPFTPRPFDRVTL